MSDLLWHRPRSAAHFRLTVDRTDPVRIWLRASGELDLAAAGLLSTVLEVGARTTAVATVRLDLAAVTLMDCACLGVLVGAHHRLRADGRQLVLAEVSAPVAQLLALTRLDRMFLVEPDLVEAPAVASFPGLRVVPPYQQAVPR